MSESDIYKLVGGRIKYIRESRKLTQQQLSDMCNIEKTNLSRIEAGRTNITLKNLFKLSKALDVSLKEIVDV